MMKLPQSLSTISELQPVFAQADHIDVKTVESVVPMRTFIAGMLNYQPGWVTALYGVRAVFVRVLGMRQEGIPRSPHLTPESLPMQPGQHAGFFSVRMAQENKYWVVEATYKHLSAALVVVPEPLEHGRTRFYVVTVVHYRHWTGPVYFNVIRPFHHLVVGEMTRAGARPTAIARA